MPGIARQCGDGAAPVTAPPPGARRAAFLDRDGTIIADAHYLSRPDQLQLIPGVTDAIRALNAAGVPVVIVTNQSGIARGYFTAEQYCAVAGALDSMLRAEGVIIEGSYHCPHLPELTGGCGCRKPGTALFRLAAARHNLALEGSLFVGDRWRDVAPALALGGVGILVPSEDTSDDERARAMSHASLLATLGDAVERFLAGKG